MRRGLTLLEVLSATVLLAVLAGVCVPILQRAARLLETERPSIELRELVELADAFIADPGEFGAESIPDRFELAWPESPDRKPVSVRALPADPDAPERWLVFMTDDWFVIRWMQVEEQP